ncbi:MAG: hypothetical protein JRH10_02060 [Deltaproteobacteria bacterium]|nr:hypothetical protein [Deltaproteobacteria bacterium]MBW2446787.1 hypothetical protein [Deltaproteobacteria bacterium]
MSSFDGERAGWLGDAARDMAERRYSSSVVCDRYETLYASLLGESPAE